mmetsp:Transcript_2702/g.8489  ORF Transcript_2702/g.8489 Transcript_2702/m.8489 type:complete len:230 (-) Transcript_2702:1093-1782(-)
MLGIVVAVAWAAVCVGEEMRISLEHSFDEAKSFEARGSMILTPSSSRNKLIRMESAQWELDAAAMGAIAAKDGFYVVRARLGDGPWAMTSVPVCWLAAAGFVEQLEVALDPRGSVLSLAYRNLDAAAGPCTLESPPVLESSVQASLDLVAQIIPVQVSASKPPVGFEAVARSSSSQSTGDEDQQGPKPKQGFFARYWHIIIPVTLIFLTARTEPPPQPSQQPVQQPAAS